MWSLLRLLLLLVPLTTTACHDYDSNGCRGRAELRGFCEGSWGAEKCCATCSRRGPFEAPAGCAVPRQKCVTWSCPRSTRLQTTGTSCQVVVKTDAACQRCSVVDSESCTPFAASTRTCLEDGSWDGAEPACRSFCDTTYVPSVEHEQLVQAAGNEADSKASSFEGIKVVDVDAPPSGPFLVNKKINKYMGKRIDVFGQPMVLFTSACERKWGDSPSLGVANQHAQWIDWQGTGRPNNPRVWANLVKYNATMVMFKKDGDRSMDKFFHRYPFDEDPWPDHDWFHPHDVGCDETPHADPDDNTTFDNAYCEVVQQLFNIGYRPAHPEVFTDKQGSRVANAMDKNIGDCGHAYDRSFKYPHCTGKYHYSDPTCDYQCLVAEYEYWALTSLLGGQDGHILPPKNRCEDIAHEWESCSKELLAKNDPDIYAIMADPQYGLPTKLAYGQYSPTSSSLVV